MIPFGTLTGLAGLVLTALNGYPWIAPWVVASIVLYGAVIAVGIVIWGRHGRRIATALAAGRLDDVRALLRSRGTWHCPGSRTWWSRSSRR